MSLDSPAAERNKQPILEVLRQVLPAAGTVLEIASGTGQHIVHFAAALPALTWQPSDPDASCRATISERLEAARMTNIRMPLALDVCEWPWPVAAPIDAIVCINLIHISPWPATAALLRGARTLLSPGAPLYLYGPYREGGEHTAASNASFDAALRAQNALWGVRDLEEVRRVAKEHGFEHPRVIRMPANNLSVVFT